MRLTVILPHADQQTSPGVRIRYERIQEHLAKRGHALDFTLIESMPTNQRANSDFYLFCKCQDVRSLLLADALAAQGRRVGVDVFDDYFSQEGDPRLSHIQAWMAEMSVRTHFFLCATPAMRDRLQGLAPGVPAHVMNDPFDSFDPQVLSGSLTERIARLRSTGQIELAWFGTGDNPYFPVGLDDLAAFGDALAAFREHGLSPHLRVLTNRRAMTPERLYRLARLPVPVSMGVWTLEGENQLLSSCHVAFLPVSAQPFSTAKSLNRAVTALTRGAQILSVGHPLYASLDPFLYRATPPLVTDLMQGTPRLHPGSLPQLAAAFRKIADPAHEVDQLLAFLSGVQPKPASSPDGRPIIVLHGGGNAAPQHKFVQRSKMFSAAGPFQEAPLNFDLKFIDRGSGRAAVVLSERIAALLDPAVRKKLEPHARTDAHVSFRMDLGALPDLGLAMTRLSERRAAYDRGMRQADSIIRSFFPAARIVAWEGDPLFKLGAKVKTGDRADV
jgi:hypothetical protein